MDNRSVILMVAPRGAFSLETVDSLVKIMAGVEIDLIPVLYGNNAVHPPEFISVLKGEKASHVRCLTPKQFDKFMEQVRANWVALRMGADTEKDECPF